MATTEPRSAAAPERGWKGGCDPPARRPCEGPALPDSRGESTWHETRPRRVSCRPEAPWRRPELGRAVSPRPRATPPRPRQAPRRPRCCPRGRDERGLRDASFCVVHFTRRDVLGVHHVAARTVFLTEHCSVCVQTTFFIHLSANGQLDSLRVLATGNRAAVTTGCRCRFETLISVPLVRTESGVTSRAVGPCPTF